MLFPFRSSSIFKNRWIALLWAAGICFTATEIVDSLSGITKDKGAPTTSSSAQPGDPVATVLDGPPPGGPPPLPEQAR